MSDKKYGSKRETAGKGRQAEAVKLTQQKWYPALGRWQKRSVNKVKKEG